MSHRDYDGYWSVSPEGSGGSYTHAGYLPVQGDRLLAKYLSDKNIVVVTVIPQASEPYLMVYYPVTHKGTELFYAVKEADDEILLDVISLKNDSGTRIMQHDYYWSDHDHWAVNNENKIISTKMKVADVKKCIEAREKFLLNDEVKSASQEPPVAPFWRCEI